MRFPCQRADASGWSFIREFRRMQPPAEIDRLVRDYVSRGESVYAVDAQALEELAPDLIVTQDLCHVCAASPDDLATALARFAEPPEVLVLESPESGRCVAGHFVGGRRNLPWPGGGEFARTDRRVGWARFENLVADVGTRAAARGVS